MTRDIQNGEDDLCVLGDSNASMGIQKIEFVQLAPQAQPDPFGQ
jgi:hypothetical protein